ncbi:hypothetical protein C1I98_06065 [Spongiactinospora gelatinilytica]|uniref:Uncharacterized protein n=1 Tax=Spongiactinospora gelatinilytica TaxID=2666298 RepID=A0A2W2HRB7_9ACTN|nr:hypothetical protein [Spongiactinospora gelatinilytica]PZG53120.1 hypothetical protein C1I98_06065 [Spongiactinospora gelatinilytica]
MTMPAEEPTIGEVARTLNRFVEDTQRRFSELSTTIHILVTRDLYEAHRSAMQEDIAQLRDELKAERDRKTADRRMVVAALISAGLSLIVAIVAAALLLALGIK